MLDSLSYRVIRREYITRIHKKKFGTCSPSFSFKTKRRIITESVILRMEQVVKFSAALYTFIHIYLIQPIYNEKSASI